MPRTKQVEEIVKETVVTITPLDLDLAGQLGQENLALVVAKVNELVTIINQ